jgi:tRNA-splicing ligase RtcB
MDLKIFTEDIEDEAREQVSRLASMEAFSGCKIRIMPDVHAGNGCVIGFTGMLGDKIIPEIVGVDIGCGVLLEKTDLADADMKLFDGFVREEIPSGFAQNRTAQAEFPEIKELRCWESLRKREELTLQIGTLGGGNHYIELDRGEDGKLWINIHTGSRNLGMQVATIYQDKAIRNLRSSASSDIREAQARLVEKMKSEGRSSEIGTAIERLRKFMESMNIPEDLCWLSGSDADDYLHDMRICQRFAVLNRKVIADKIVGFLGARITEKIESVHNYIDDEGMIRKGAVAAHKGQRLVIPMNMRDGILICTGLGNPDWNESAPHGAGRLMSRSTARKALSVDEFMRQMDGIYSTTVCASTIDESPMAYKPADEIKRLIGPTAKIEEIVKPAYSFKDTGEKPDWKKMR